MYKTIPEKSGMVFIHFDIKTYEKNRNLLYNKKMSITKKRGNN